MDKRDRHRRQCFVDIGACPACLFSTVLAPIMTRCPLPHASTSLPSAQPEAPLPLALFDDALPKERIAQAPSSPGTRAG